MKSPEHHLFLCGSFRVNGEAQGVCTKNKSLELLSYLQGEVQDRMLDGVEVAATGCMNACAHGPVMIDYPSGQWYGKIDEDAIDAILDGIEEGTVAEDYLISS
ncbi:MAG: (2Fe-2S) ferredoxin domain-containing protein [Planctomycetes bacterium]|nr:(2Fe-2S) ferredoxin domain-containing protein [Planctomycetota bacterium]